MSTDKTPEISFLRNVGLMMTYRCQVACPHCVVAAGPHRKEEVALEEALDWAGQIAGYRNGRIKVLSLTGGEPFCCLDKLKKIIDFAARSGMFVTVVTNAFWAKSQDEAVQVLRKLEGLKMLGISADAHHQMAIPFDRVRNAILAAQECGLSLRILAAAEDEAAPAHQAMLASLHELTSPENLQPVATFLAGRALAEIDASRYRTSGTPCQSRCAAAGAPVLFPDGQVIACIGALIALPIRHPLVLGNLRENSLAEILDKAEVNSILHTLRIWGPSKLVSMIEQSELKCELPSRYIENTICDPCYKIMSNPRLAEWVAQLATDHDHKRTVAYGRAYHLKEIEMLNSLGWR